MQTQFITIAAASDEPIDPPKIVALAKTVEPSAYAVNTVAIDAATFDPEGKPHEQRTHYLPLNRDEIEELCDSDHRMNVIVSVTQTDYMRAFVEGQNAVVADKHFDLLHREAFGSYDDVEDQTAQIIAADEHSFIVAYSCRFMDL